MNVNDPKILRLRAQIKAAEEDFETAVMFHESWKPAAYDKELHQRLRNSYAAHTFVIVRTALRREMLLALLRLWDGNADAVGMDLIAETLRDRAVIGALAADRASRFDAADRAEGLMRRDLGRLADDAIELIEKYSRGGSHHAVREKLWALQSRSLVHRQIAMATAADAADDEIESFYQDNLALVRLLLSLVRAVAYNPEDAAKIYRLNAASFWGEVRGERRKPPTNE